MNCKKVLLILTITFFAAMIIFSFWAYLNPEGLRVILDKFFVKM